jgi:hypothetical protein
LSGFEFISSLVGSLAWPVTIVLVVVLLRERLKAVLTALSERFPFLTEMQAFGVQAKFQEGVEQVKKEVSKLESSIVIAGDPGQLPPLITAANEERYRQLADLSPRATILEGFIRLEAAVLGAASRMGWTPGPRNRSFRDAFEYLAKTAQLGPDVRHAVTEINSLRNRAVHQDDFMIPAEAALDLALTADRLARLIDSIGDSGVTP